MKPKHSQGPWTFEGRKYGDMGLAINGPKETVAIAVDDYKPREEAEANARLIAAAPELFKACKIALQMCVGLKSMSNLQVVLNAEDFLREAITKATSA